jgi:lysophospholipase L1-like esterase
MNALSSPARPGLSPAKRRVFAFLLLGMIGFLFALIEWTATRMMPDDLTTGRLILLGDENAQLVRMQNTIPQPYLHYIHAPNYASTRFGAQHNADGYRGEAVPMQPQSEVYRILCLGGSTTYGASVGRPEEAYPAVLAELLNAQSTGGVGRVEVINGGLTWGTTAELLNHYHFKFRYYRPDLVIINVGGNDAQAYIMPYYHPDYSHWRQPMVNLRPLPHAWRWLARSRLFSSAILRIFYSDQLEGGQFVYREGTRPVAPWFKPEGKVIKARREIPDEHLAFLHNMEALIRSIQAAGGRVLLVPFRAAPDGYKGRPFELSQILRHEELLKRLALQYTLGFAPFPASIISPENWTDHCHLDPSGEREKATHIAEYVRPFLPVVPH